jgi:hypothetical protein
MEKEKEKKYYRTDLRLIYKILCNPLILETKEKVAVHVVSKL